MNNGSPYKIGRTLGRGGMAEVFVALRAGVEPGGPRFCALKKIHPSLVEDTGLVALLLDEARICQELSHRNVLRFHELTHVEGIPAIAMELVEGIDLKNLLRQLTERQASLPVAMAVHIAAEAACGLHYAHTRRDRATARPLEIVHRDVAPDNILISFDGAVKIADFGVARARTRASQTEPGVVRGKFPYMSPEQVSDHSVDARSDIFSLALVLWECLTMERFFPEGRPLDYVKAIATVSYRPCRHPRDGTIDGELEEILIKALARSPNERWPDAASFEAALRRYLATKHPRFHERDLANFVKVIGQDQRLKLQRSLSELTAPEPSQVPAQPQRDPRAASMRNSIPLPRSVPNFGLALPTALLSPRLATRSRPTVGTSSAPRIRLRRRNFWGRKSTFVAMIVMAALCGSISTATPWPLRSPRLAFMDEVRADLITAMCQASLAESFKVCTKEAPRRRLPPKPLKSVAPPAR